MQNNFEPAGGDCLSGIVEEIVFQNVENGFTVLALSVDGELVSAVGTLPELSAGEELDLRGRWDEHNLFGRQFKIEEFERRMPETTAGLLKYLSSGAIKGIGPKTAVRIIERFGENSFHVLENEPERLAVITGISKEKAVQISNEYNKQTAIRNVMISLERYGIRPMECIAVFKRFGSAAIDIINENPYILCSAVETIGFERAEKISERLPHTPSPHHRLRAGVLHVLRHNTHNGHTCVPRSKLFAPCRELLAADDDTIEITVDSLLNDKMLVKYDIDGVEFLFLPDMYLHEKNIAERMRSLMKFPPREIQTLEKDIDLLEQLDGIQYEGLQKRAIRTAVQKGMLILTGGPGTGKTTTVKGILRLFERQNLEIVLAAPTGRAAKRLSEVTGMEAKTIHRLLEVAWDDSDRPTFKRDMQNPLTCDVVILDELSMVDVYLFSSLLTALRFGCRIILVGDSDQLPPVGAGNVLLDLIKSETIPTVCLTEIFRQARESLIVMNAHAIIAGAQPELHKRDGDFFFMER
ncbi:MAG: AAA family ATPase, partial [Oscillospiraceae bacterium]|nr:AAA family ATPase [Oscillospiraceae bacterium]